jgi:hypothetical protein
MDNIICLVAGAFIGSLIASVVISAMVLAERDERIEEWERMERKSKREAEREE